MRTLQQFWQSHGSDRRLKTNPNRTKLRLQRPFAHPGQGRHVVGGLRTIARIAFALSFILLIGSSLSVQADPGTTVLLPLVSASGTSQPKPLAVDDRYQTIEDQLLVINAANGVLANDSDPQMAPLQAVLESDVSHGVLNLKADGSFNYKPDPGFSGEDKFTYRAASDTAVSIPATATLTISKKPTGNAPRIISGEMAFTKQVIGTDVKRAHFAYGADFDGDNDLDVIATLYGTANGGIGGMVLWHENDGSGNFAQKVLDPDLPGAYPAHIADVDLDGVPDVLAGGYDSDTFAWYRNDGRANFTRKDIDTSADGAHSIITNDLDEDGDIDLVTSGQDGNFISWYENNGKNSFKSHIIDKAALGAKRAEVADLDGDGDKDVVAASFDGHEIAWYENDGKQNFTKLVIDKHAAGAYYAEPADIDSDGDIDVFSANRRDDTVAWYENDGAGSFTKHIVDDDSIKVRTVIAVDMDRDGDIDALAASVDDDTVAWHENDGSGSFTKHVIDRAADGAYAGSAIDMDFDGDYDVLSASRDSAEVALHTQIRAHEATVKKGGTLIIDATLLLTVSANNSPADLTYTISGAPQFGELQLDGIPLPQGGTFTQADVNNGNVAYEHTGSKKTADEFTFAVAGSENDGLQPASGIFSLKIK